MASLQDIQSQIGQRRTMQVREKQLEGKLASKKDWYQFLEQNL